MGAGVVGARYGTPVLEVYSVADAKPIVHLEPAPSPIVSLNRAVAIAMTQGPQAALELIDELSATGELDEYHLLHAARADMLRRVGSSEAAAESYQTALELVTNDSERRFLERRLREVRSVPQ